MSGQIGSFLQRLLARTNDHRLTENWPLAAGSAESIERKVLVVSYDPAIPQEGGQRLSQRFGWQTVDTLVKQAIADLRQASHGICNFQVVKHTTVDAFPVKIDGFHYSAAEYVRCWRARNGFHHPDWADYRRIVDDFHVAEQIQAGYIDELWLFAFPYGGFYESRMAGPGAFWCNALPLEGFDHLSRRFVIMGFNYERGVGEMLESFGHRAESILAHVFREARGEADLWSRFTRYDREHPGRAEVGNVHFAPNSERDYDWGNRRQVLSGCDAWLNFPDLSGPPRMVDCRDWGNGDTRLHHLWWFTHFPHAIGQKDGYSNNWWQYVANPNLVP